MSLVPGLDSAYPPLLTEVQQAHQQGYRWWGCYLGGIPNTDPLNPWTPAQIELLEQGGVLPLPIVVPIPTLAGDPIATAHAAIAQAKLAGLSPGISILYDGVGVRNTRGFAGPFWVPEPGPAPSSVPSMSAVQYGYGTIGGTLNVDLNLASPDFPFSNGLVCDFEENILDYVTLADAMVWYQQFQSVFPVVPPPNVIEEDRMYLLICTAAYTIPNSDTVISIGEQFTLMAGRLTGVASGADSLAFSTNLTVLRLTGQQIAAWWSAA